jgi:2'-5' RNA ligase
MSSAESALVVLVPAAEPLVGSFRQKYDASAAEGMPAHITILYPFLPPDRIDRAVLDLLRQCFARHAPFRFSLARTGRIAAKVLYLVPDPAEPFRELTLAIWNRYPQTPPYGGKHTNILPHLTVAQLANERELNRVAEEFAKASPQKLPIHAAVTEVALTDNRSGRWQVRASLGLGGLIGNL